MLFFSNYDQENERQFKSDMFRTPEAVTISPTSCIATTST